jgi:hypothetical protein
VISLKWSEVFTCHHAWFGDLPACAGVVRLLAEAREGAPVLKYVACRCIRSEIELAQMEIEESGVIVMGAQYSISLSPHELTHQLIEQQRHGFSRPPRFNTQWKAFCPKWDPSDARE